MATVTLTFTDLDDRRFEVVVESVPALPAAPKGGGAPGSQAHLLSAAQSAALHAMNVLGSVHLDVHPQWESRNRAPYKLTARLPTRLLASPRAR